jgi:hypothetical protein
MYDKKSLSDDIWYSVLILDWTSLWVTATVLTVNAETEIYEGSYASHVTLFFKIPQQKNFKKLFYFSFFINSKKATGRSFHYEIAGDFPLFYSTLSFVDDLICLQNLMGMVSFLSSLILGTFGLKKWKECIQKGAYFNVFLGQQFRGSKKGRKMAMFYLSNGFCPYYHNFYQFGL